MEQITPVIRAIDVSEMDIVVDALRIDPTILPKWLGMLMRDEMTMLVAYMDDKPVGKVNIVWTGEDQPEVRNAIGVVPNIVALHVNGAFQRRGIGEALMKAAEDEVRGRGGITVQGLSLGVEPDNGPARRLYEKLGYVYNKVGVRETFTAEWDETRPDGLIIHISVPVLLMTKRI